MKGDFRIGPWLVEPTLNRISRNGASRHLEPKVMQVLLCLSDADGDVVSKQKLIDEVWKETFVSDDVLTRSISELRAAFGDDARDSRIIQTVAKQGYRLLPAIKRAPRLWQRHAVAVAVVLAIALASAAFIYRERQRARELDIRSIVVLPFTNLSSDSDEDYLADGMTEALIADLSRIEGIRVISRTSAMQYKGTKRSLAEIGRDLDVQAVIEGSVTRQQDRVRVVAQLIRAPTEKHLWSETFDRDMPDILSLQAELANAVGQRVRGKLGVLGTTRAARKVDPEAYRLYLQGRYHTLRMGPAHQQQAEAFLQQAIGADQNFAAPYAALAVLYSIYSPWTPPAETRAKGIAAAERALAIDANSAEAHAARASIAFGLEWDPDTAKHHFEEALRIDPTNEIALSEYAFYLSALARTNEGVQVMHQLLARDPLNKQYEDNMAFQLNQAGRYEDALEHVNRVLAADPGKRTAARVQKWLALTMLRRYEEALQECQQIYYATACAVVYGRMGNHAAARKILRDFESGKLEDLDPWCRIAAYEAIGERDKALQLFEKPFREKSGFMIFLKKTPLWEPLQSDLRYQRMLKAVFKES